MNSLSGASAFDPQQMMQKMQDRMQLADADQNGSLSKTEATAQLEESGRQGPNFEKMFDKADANGDGQLSQDEQTKMFEQMQQRMEQFDSIKVGGAPTSAYGNSDTFKSLLDSLNADDNDSEDNSDKKLRDALQDINRNKQQDIGSHAWQTLHELAPPINTYA